MKAIILAAGFGTCLYPLTRDTPKALLMLGNKTILDHLVEKLAVISAVDEILLVTNGRFCQQFLEWKNNAKYLKPIHVISNGVMVSEERFGAVHDLYFALRSGCCGSDDFLVFCGDNYFDFSLGYFLLPVLGHSDSVFIGLYDVNDLSKASLYGVVSLDVHNRVVDFQEKPSCPESTLVSLGVYYFPNWIRGRVHEYLKGAKNFARIGDFVAWLSSKEEMFGVSFDGVWFDMGDFESFYKAACHLASKMNSLIANNSGSFLKGELTHRDSLRKPTCFCAKGGISE